MISPRAETETIIKSTEMKKEDDLASKLKENRVHKLPNKINNLKQYSEGRTSLSPRIFIQSEDQDDP